MAHELDSEDALRRVHTERWDLLITDIELPGMSGLELLERVRELVPDLPVAVLTGHPTVDYAVSALRGAAAEFLLKPVSPGTCSPRRPSWSRRAARPGPRAGRRCSPSARTPTTSRSARAGRWRRTARPATRWRS